MAARLIPLISLSFFFVACSGTLPGVSSNEHLDPGSSYIAAFLGFNYEESALRLALEIDCEGKSLYVELPKNSASREVALYPVGAGICVIAGVAPMGGIGDIAPTKEFSDQSPYKFNAAPGSINYIGRIDVSLVPPASSQSTQEHYVIEFRGREFYVYPSYVEFGEAKQKLATSYRGINEMAIIDVYPFNK